MNIAASCGVRFHQVMVTGVTTNMFLSRFVVFGFMKPMKK